MIFLLSVGSERENKKVLQERGMLRKWEWRRSQWIKCFALFADFWTGGIGTFKLQAPHTPNPAVIPWKMPLRQQQVLWHSPSPRGCFSVPPECHFLGRSSCRRWLWHQDSSTQPSSRSLGTGCPWTTLEFWEGAELEPDGSLGSCLTFINPRIPAEFSSQIHHSHTVLALYLRQLKKSCRHFLCINRNFSCVLVWKCGTPNAGSSRNFSTFLNLSLGVFYLYI